MTTESKIKKLVRQTIPKGKPFKITWQPAGKGHYHVVRVITPAWRSLRRSERNRRMEEAFQHGLTEAERRNIFFVSVLTAEEYNPLRRILKAAGTCSHPILKGVRNGTLDWRK